jgi:hypothetical protein
MTFAYDPYYKANYCTSLDCAYREEPETASKHMEVVEDNGVVYVFEARRHLPRRVKKAFADIHLATVWPR